MQEINQRYYNARDVATYLGFTERYIRELHLRGKIPSHKIGKAVRFDLEEINSWIKEKKCYDGNIKNLN